MIFIIIMLILLILSIIAQRVQATSMILVMLVTIISCGIFIEHLGTGIIEVLENEKSGIVKSLESPELMGDPVLRIEALNNAASWNKDIQNNRKYQKNLFVGIFIPNIYDDIELINATKIKDITTPSGKEVLPVPVIKDEDIRETEQLKDENRRLRAIVVQMMDEGKV